MTADRIHDEGVAVIAQLAPGETAVMFRRSLLLSLIIGGVGLIVLAALGHYVAGVFLLVGLGLGAFNGRLVLVSIASFAAAGEAVGRGALIMSMMRRLALVSAIALAIVWFYRPEGIAVLAGLATFQTLVIGRAGGALFREIRTMQT